MTHETIVKNKILGTFKPKDLNKLTAKFSRKVSRKKGVPVHTKIQVQRNVEKPVEPQNLWDYFFGAGTEMVPEILEKRPADVTAGDMRKGLQLVSVDPRGHVVGTGGMRKSTAQLTLHDADGQPEARSAKLRSAGVTDADESRVEQFKAAMSRKTHNHERRPIRAVSLAPEATTSYAAATCNAAPQEAPAVPSFRDIMSDGETGFFEKEQILPPEFNRWAHLAADKVDRWNQGGMGIGPAAASGGIGIGNKNRSTRYTPKEEYENPMVIGAGEPEALPQQQYVPAAGPVFAMAA